ncbi:MAG: cysteine hydrolase family protein [Candidatus Omnitrophota bacterium]|nr:cysteine hydrolase family protein [Candidatus Omnitrophota bacterium]
MKEIVFIDIDTQYDFMFSKGRLYINEAEKIIPNLKLLTEAAFKRDILIISTADTHLKNDPEFKQFPAHCVEKTHGQKKIPQTLLKKHIFIPRKILTRKELLDTTKGHKQIIIEKNTYDVFTNFNLSRLLKPFNEAFIYGVAVDYCVKYAVLGLLQNGLKVNLVMDAVSAVEPKEGKALLAKFKNNGVKLVKTREVINRLKAEI